jgi:N-methylhydantoinase B
MSVQPMQPEGTTASTDPAGVRLAVVVRRLEAVVRQMTNTLVRTGRSGILNTARDFSCCVLTRDGQLLAMAESLPIHLMSGPDLMVRAMHARHPSIRPGDAFLHNSPYLGNSHAADHSLIVPVFDEQGTHRFTVLAKAHQADCGNSAPTTYHASARDVYEEGALIFPCVKVQEDYEDRSDILEMCRARIRVPKQWWGDYLALVGAARIGERKLLELGAELGWEELDAYGQQWLEYAEKAMRSELEQLPEATITVEGAHDPFPGVPKGIPIRVSIQTDPKRGRIEVDLRDNPDCQPCGLNLSEATARTAGLVGVFNALPSPVPANAGSLSRVDVRLRENCVVGIPRFPASCSVATTNLADRVINAVQRGIAELAEGCGLGEAGLIIPPAGAVISGADERTGERFVNQILLPGYGAGPGGPAADGWLTLAHAGGAGVCFRDSVEFDELRYPLMIREQRIMPDTGGAGQHRGAPGSRVELGPVRGDMEVAFLSDGTVHPALGARGGEPGNWAQQWKRERDGNLVELDACQQLTLHEGETVVSISSGGGGYGPPTVREHEAVARDVAEGWVSKEAALRAYKVVLDPSGRVDAARTQSLRAEGSA